MGAFDQFKNQSEKRGDKPEEMRGAKRRRGAGAGAEGDEPMGSERSMPQEPRESGSRSRPGAGAGSGAGSEFDEGAQRRSQQRMRDAESGEDENEWA